MLTRPAVLAVALGVIAVPGHADEVDDLFAALKLPEVLAVMQQEGLSYGESLADTMLEGQVGKDWATGVAEIYDLERLEGAVRGEFRAGLEGVDLTPMLAFFTSEPGATITRLEVSAREAMLDDDVETAARETAALAMADQTDRFLVIEEFAEANDLIETNVVSALNSNFAFYKGLQAGGALPATMTEDEVLAEVWGREDQLRQTTTEWVVSFLMLAYAPLSDADIEAYTAFSETEPGQALNRAVFQAFEMPFQEVSRALGLLVATEMLRQDI